MFHSIFFYVGLFIGASYLISLLTPKPEVQDAEPGDLQVPTIEEGTPYTILFGTMRIEDPIVAWYGDKQLIPIEKKIGETGGFFGIGSEDVYQTIGYWYLLGMHVHICYGVIDGVKQVWFGDIMGYPITGLFIDPTDVMADGTTAIYIDEEYLFGGEEKGGGIVGWVSFEYGSASQTPNSYLITQLGGNIPASRDVTGAVFHKIKWGTSPYISKVSFLCKRTDVLTTGNTQWYIAKADIDGSLNAAHIIRECMTDNVWGGGQSTSLFNDAVWQPVADTLYDEGFGLNFKWKSKSVNLEQFVKDVLRHIDAVLYQNLSTSEFILKLIRDDYTVGALDTYDDDDIISVDDFTRGTYGEVPDEIWVEFWDNINHRSVSIPDIDIALIEMQGGRVAPLYQKYLGISDPTLAAKVAARDRQQIGAFNATFKIRAKRTMYDIYPGDVFKMSWSPLGIESMVVRVYDIDYGSLENGEIILTCSEDIFAVQNALFADAPSTGWTDINNDADDVTVIKLIETPYYELYRQLGQTELATLAADDGLLSIQAEDPTGDSLYYSLMLRDSPAGSFYDAGNGYFSYTDLITDDMPENAQDVVVTLENGTYLFAIPDDSYCVIDDEILKIKSVDVSNKQITLARGCLDTVPALHTGPDTAGANAARVWFMYVTNKMAYTTYTTTNQPGVKLLPTTSKSSLAIGDATAYSATAFNSRMVRPYPPGDFKVDGSSYPSTFSGQPTITWKHRDRTQQLSGITEHSDASVGPEAGTTYTLSIYDETGVGLLRTVTGLTGETYTYSYDDEIADSGLQSGDPLNSSLRFVLKSVRNGYDSWQSYDITVNRS